MSVVVRATGRDGATGAVDLACGRDDGMDLHGAADLRLAAFRSRSRSAGYAPPLSALRRSTLLFQ